jgi:hypothetical protein
MFQNLSWLFLLIFLIYIFKFASLRLEPMDWWWLFIQFIRNELAFVWKTCIVLISTTYLKKTFLSWDMNDFIRFWLFNFEVFNILVITDHFIHSVAACRVVTINILHRKTSQLKDLHMHRLIFRTQTTTMTDFTIDLSPFEWNFDLDKSGQKFHHSLKEHHKISNIPKFRCEML